MNKIIAMLLVAVMALGLVACAAAPAETTAAPTTTAPAETQGTEPIETEPVVTEPIEETVAVVAAENEASKVLSAIWALYTDDNKFFAMGGDYAAPVDGAPGVVTAGDFMTASLIVPEAEVANIAEAASLMHAMNANTFTSGAFKLAEGVDAAAFITTMQTAIQGNQWMCGFPESLLIANVDGIIVVAFGHGDAMTPFTTNLTAAYAGAEIVVNEPIA